MHCANRPLGGRGCIGPIAAAVLGMAASTAVAMPSRAHEPVTDAAVFIELRPQATLRGADVQLGDIANLRTRDLPLLRRMMALPIGRVARAESATTVDRDTVARWVAARSGGVAMQWSGAEQIRIESATRLLSGEQVVEAARGTLLGWLAARSRRAEVQPLSVPHDVWLPVGEVTLQVRPLPAQAVPSRRMQVWIDAWVDGRFVRTLAVSFQVAAWAPANVAAVALERGAPLDAITARAAFERREVDLAAPGRRGTPVGASAASAAPSSAGQRMRRPLTAGEVLTDAALEAVPAVERGRWAHLQARSGEVSIQGRVEVLQDGRLGQTVRVRLAGARAELLARVTGPGEVEVQP